MRVYLVCRTCGDRVDRCEPEDLDKEELQSWYNIRNELDYLRKNWPGFISESPRIERDYNEELTRFLCHHKDHDLCMIDLYDPRTIVEFKLPEAQDKATGPRRCFRELKNREGFTSDIMEIDEAPRLYHSIIKHHKKIDWGQCESSVSVTATPYGTVRFVYYKEELVLLRTYLEE